MTWKRIAAGVTSIAVAISSWWMLKPVPPTAAPVAPQASIEPVTPDPEMLAFGLDSTARDLTLRSRLGVDVQWSVRTGSRFEIAPETGTIKASGSTVVRVTPKSSSLTLGLNSEHTWFTWSTADGATRQRLVRLTALRAPEVDYTVVEADGELVLTLNGTEVARARATNRWHTVSGGHALHTGANQLDVRVAGSRQGARFILMLRAGSKEMAVSDATEMPVTITLDPDLGFISLAAPAGRP